jgi:hypothetical protein
MALHKTSCYSILSYPKDLLMLRYLSFFVCSGLLVALAGCSSEGAGLLGVKGTVNFEGKALAKGTINFELEDRTLLSGAPIEDGRFSIPQARGLKPGTYLVRISSAEGIVKDEGQAPGDSAGVVGKEKIPASWNSESKQKVEVKAGATDLTFDVK